MVAISMATGTTTVSANHCIQDNPQHNTMIAVTIAMTTAMNILLGVGNK